MTAVLRAPHGNICVTSGRGDRCDEFMILPCICRDQKGGVGVTGSMGVSFSTADRRRKGAGKEQTVWKLTETLGLKQEMMG